MLSRIAQVYESTPMTEPVERRNRTIRDRRLADAIREVKNAFADRDEVVVDIREAQRTRLELLAEDLQPVFADIPDDDDRFDLAISMGMQPRLWIDSVAHVTMGRDRRTYRFLRATRSGHVVLAESPDMSIVARQVTRYVADRVIERRRMMEGDVSSPAMSVTEETAISGRKNFWGDVFLRALGIVMLGGLAGSAVVALWAWLRLGEINLRF
jgi:hypothetical protein